MKTKQTRSKRTRLKYDFSPTKPSSTGWLPPRTPAEKTTDLYLSSYWLQVNHPDYWTTVKRWEFQRYIDLDTPSARLRAYEMIAAVHLLIETEDP